MGGWSMGMKHAQDSENTGTSIGQEILAGLEGMRDALRDGEKLHHRFTMRTVELDLDPVEYTARDIQRIRERLSASQRAFAMLLGIKTSTLQKWEQGTTAPSAMACRLLEMMERNPTPWIDRLESAIKTRSAS